VNYLLMCLLVSAMMVAAVYLPREAVFYFAGAFGAIGVAAGLWDLMGGNAPADDLADHVAASARARSQSDATEPASARWRPPRRAA
jgi:hypothetical protein